MSTIRTSIFSNQNCELSLDDSGDLLLTYLDGDRQGIKKKLAEMLKQRKKIGLNRVSWWGNRGVQIEIKDQFDFLIWLSNRPVKVGLELNWKSLNLGP